MFSLKPLFFIFLQTFLFTRYFIFQIYGLSDKQCNGSLLRKPLNLCVHKTPP